MKEIEATMEVDGEVWTVVGTVDPTLPATDSSPAEGGEVVILDWFDENGLRILETEKTDALVDAAQEALLCAARLERLDGV